MKMRKTLVALLATAALASAGCGDDESSGAGSGASGGGNGTDRAFVAAMVPHHEGAIEMAEIARRRGESAFVKTLAGDIVSSQSDEIATLRREDEALDGAGVEKGSLGVPEDAMGMDHDPAELETAEPFDKAFLEMMIPHHDGAIEMAEAELAEGADPELKALAQQILTAQRREIDAMREHLGLPGEGSAGEAEHDEHGSGHSG